MGGRDRPGGVALLPEFARALSLNPVQLEVEFNAIRPTPFGVRRRFAVTRRRCRAK